MLSAGHVHSLHDNVKVSNLDKSL